MVSLATEQRASRSIKTMPNKARERSHARILYTNIRSIMNKRDELEELIATCCPLLVALTETWLSSDIADSEVAIPGYSVFRSDRDVRNGGGVMLLVRYDLDVQLVKRSSDPEGCYEGVWCKVKFSPSGYDAVGVVYRSPGSHPSLLLDDLEQFSTTPHCLILGDFNSPLIDWTTNTCTGADQFTRELFSTLIELFLHQHVNVPTRLSANCSNILDYILSSAETNVHALQTLPPIGKSDHVVLSFLWNRSSPIPQHSDGKINVWKIPFAQMRSAASNVDWVPTDADVESLWTHISEHIKLLVDKFAPKWKPRRLSKGPPWFDTELRKALRQRNRAWRNFKSTGSGYEHYQSIRNKCSSMKLSKRKTYEENLAITAVSAPKRLFAYLNRRTRTDCRVSLTSTNGERMTAKDMAEIFAVQYAETYAPDLEPIPMVDDKASSPWLDDVISLNEVKEFLHTLNTNKSPGPDGIHPLVLKELADVIAMPLTVLFNMSIQCGKLPSEWKTAVIKPMYKSGSRSLPVNYRPVSLTCIACKYWKE